MNNKCTIFLRNQFKIKHQQPNIFSSRQSIDSPRYSIKDKASTAQHTMLLRRRAQSAVERRGAGKASGRQNLGDCGARGRGRRRGGPRAPRERETYSRSLSQTPAIFSARLSPLTNHPRVSQSFARPIPRRAVSSTTYVCLPVCLHG